MSLARRHRLVVELEFHDEISVTEAEDLLYRALNSANSDYWREQTYSYLVLRYKNVIAGLRNAWRKA